jgi:hypothetical protein
MWSRRIELGLLRLASVAASKRDRRNEPRNPSFFARYTLSGIPARRRTQPTRLEFFHPGDAPTEDLSLNSGQAGIPSGRRSRTEKR